MVWISKVPKKYVLGAVFVIPPPLASNIVFKILLPKN